jgi:ADP-heptose:LPS heptosyltransferase
VRATRLAVIRALPGLGDLLCAQPALAALRAAHPSAEITLVGLPSAAWFVRAHPHLVDDLMPVVGVPGLPEVTPDPQAAVDFLAAALARRFDLAVQVHGTGVVTNRLTTMLGARHQVTAHVPGQWRPPGTSIPYPDCGHEIHRMLAVTAAAGAPPVGTDLWWEVDGADAAEAVQLLERSAPSHHRYACLHPGASRPANRWPPERFAAVGDALAEAGCRIVLTGSRAERLLTAAVARALRAPAVDLAGRTTVRTLAALYAGARLVVSNDTGAAHLAAAVRAPSVVVFPASGDPARWAPLDTRRHVVVVPEPGSGPWPPTAAVLASAAHQMADAAAPDSRALEPR